MCFCDHSVWRLSQFPRHVQHGVMTFLQSVNMWFHNAMIATTQIQLLKQNARLGAMTCQLKRGWFCGIAAVAQAIQQACSLESLVENYVRMSCSCVQNLV